ncbi:hypothetical protein FSP39_015033 [Pinctada imbricata]|uniref:Carbonic anhydrase n=1 Tax=Pinctada imbricata TaxID=66713 RepID=A0AA88XG97_PINIB|nr:hypothetical protein FSP39_015033 [Pinctada imbricata]
MVFGILLFLQIANSAFADLALKRSQIRFIKVKPHGVHWSYHGEFGPANWLSVYPHCGGEKQSPVHIDSTKVFVDRKLDDFNFHGYDATPERNLTIKNNGHTVKVSIEGPLPQVSGGGLKDSYSAAQFHFHWGSVDDRGSEHAMDGKNYPMEMHLVHYADKYRSLNEAVDKPDGLKVLGFFFEIGDRNPNFDKLISHFNSIKHKDAESTLEPISLHSLMPENLSVYFRYHGSLTTPPCFESVTWTVFKDTVKISKQQMESFRHTLKGNSKGEKDEALTEIYRPLQPLNSRNIYASKVFERPIDDPLTRAILRDSAIQSSSFLSIVLTVVFFVLFS